MDTSRTSGPTSERAIGLDADARPLHNAYALARAALAAYPNSPERDPADFFDAFPHHSPFRGQRVSGFVVSDPDHVILAFRGSHEDREWIRGLSYGQVPSGGGRVHRGLSETLDEVWRDVLCAFYDASVHDKTLWLTGHSIGGSLATLAARRLHDEGFSVHFACTFGAPRVLDPVAAREFPVPLYRFVNNEDLVPDLPWPSLTDRYAHAGKRILLLASGQIAEDRHSPGLSRRIDRADTIGQGIVPSGMVHDHAMENYLEKIARVSDTD
ncbi:MAG: lipase family protein [Candidatus Hydrogenedentes bacterium]|nr:lipase family protein [Candidatus Hydrogenedentota bacterium]